MTAKARKSFEDLLAAALFDYNNAECRSLGGELQDIANGLELGFPGIICNDTICTSVRTNAKDPGMRLIKILSSVFKITIII